MGAARTAVSPQDLFRVALRADANAIAVVREEPAKDVAMAKHDLRAPKRFGEIAAWLNIQFVDYLVLSARSGLRQPRFHSWRRST